MGYFNGVRYAALVLTALAGLTAPAIAQSAFEDPGSRVASAGAGGDFATVNNPITGDVSLGASSQIVVLFRNDDSKPVKPGAINLYPSSNISASVGENQCSASPEAEIAPGEICAISLQVKGLQQGNYRIEMLMRHSGRSKLLTATVSGTVASTGNAAQDIVSDIEAIPPEIDFESLNESGLQVKSVVLRNITSQPITITDISIEAGAQSGYSIKQNCEELQTGEACVVTVTWAPKQKGPASGALIVRHTGATGVVTVGLEGDFSPTEAVAATTFPQPVPGKGLLVSSQEEMDFGTGIEQASSMTVSLVNAGDVPLTLTGIRMANTDNGVRIESRGCTPGTVLAPIEACPLTLTWEPVRQGNIVDDLQVMHTGARGILVLPLRGNAAKAVNKNDKAIIIGDYDLENELARNIRPLSVDDISTDFEGIDGDTAPSEPQSIEGGVSVAGTSLVRQANVRGALEGYRITSYSQSRAIVTGPGGSRVVVNNDRAVIGGVLWEVQMRPSAVEFSSNGQKVLLLFDTSLSSINQDSSQSGSGTVSSTSGSSTTTTSTTE